MSEQAKTGLIVGAKDHGKTDYVRGNKQHNLPGFFKSKIDNGIKILIIDTVDHPSYRDIPIIKKEQLDIWTKGIYRIFVPASEMPEIYEILNTRDNLWNTFVVWEDAFKHCQGVCHKKLRELIIDSKNKNIEMIFLYHAWGWIPNDLFKIIQFIQVFKTGDSPIKKYSEMPGYEDETERIYTKVLKHKFKYFNDLIITGI